MKKREKCKEGNAPPRGRPRSPEKAAVNNSKKPFRPRAYPLAVRKRAVQLHLEEGITTKMVAQEIGISQKTLYAWVQRFRQQGQAGLERIPSGPRVSRSKLPEAVQEKIVALKREDPRQGVRRISQVLRRLFWMKASPSTVREQLAHVGMMAEKKKARRKIKVPPRRFERSTPNQMWQTDITYYPILGKTAYIIGFIDDHSRYITSLGVYRSQPSAYVVELYRQGVAQYGAPKEMLTDNGRQYASWRGKTQFQKELQKDHILHVRSAPHHPMTLGKIERFWQTLKDEFLEQARFETFEEARARIAWWVQYYNHKRPHQSLDGLSPADRFFAIQKEMRAAIERGVAANVEELARRGKPLEPLYMVGRMGEKSVVITTENKRMSVRVDGQELSADHPLVYELKEGATHENGSNNGAAASADHKSLQCEGKESGGAVAVERPPQCLGAYEDDGSAVGGGEQLGEAGAERHAVSARPELAETHGEQPAAAPCGAVDARDTGTGGDAEGRINPEENHGNENTGALRSDGEMPCGADGVDGTQTGVAALPGDGRERLAVLAVAGPGAVGYAGCTGTAWDERGCRGPGAVGADPAVARPEGTGDRTSDSRADGTGTPSGTNPPPVSRPGSSTGEVSNGDNGRGPESTTAHEGGSGTPDGADQCHGSGTGPGRQPQDVLRMAGPGSGGDPVCTGGPSDRSALAACGSAEGRTPVGTGAHGDGALCPGKAFAHPGGDPRSSGAGCAGRI